MIITQHGYAFKLHVSGWSNLNDAKKAQLHLKKFILSLDENDAQQYHQWLKAAEADYIDWDDARFNPIWEVEKQALSFGKRSFISDSDRDCEIKAV